MEVLAGHGWHPRRTRRRGRDARSTILRYETAAETAPLTGQFQDQSRSRGALRRQYGCCRFRERGVSIYKIREARRLIPRTGKQSEGTRSARRLCTTPAPGQPALCVGITGAADGLSCDDRGGRDRRRADDRDRSQGGPVEPAADVSPACTGRFPALDRRGRSAPRRRDARRLRRAASGDMDEGAGRLGTGWRAYRAAARGRRLRHLHTGQPRRSAAVDLSCSPAA